MRILKFLNVLRKFPSRIKRTGFKKALSHSVRQGNKNIGCIPSIFALSAYPAGVVLFPFPGTGLAAATVGAYVGKGIEIVGKKGLQAVVKGGNIACKHFRPNESIFLK